MDMPDTLDGQVPAFALKSRQTCVRADVRRLVDNIALPITSFRPSYGLHICGILTEHVDDAHERSTSTLIKGVIESMTESSAEAAYPLHEMASLTAEIVAAFVSNNAIAPPDLPNLI